VDGEGQRRETVPERPDILLINLGRRLIHSVLVVHRTLANYSPGHPALAPPLADLGSVVRTFERHREEASLSLRDDQLYVGETRIKPDASGFAAYVAVIRLLKSGGIGAVHFSTDAPPTHLEAWFDLLRRAEERPAGERLAWIQRGMEQRGLIGVQVEPPPEAGQRETAQSRDRKERAKAIYAQTMGMLGEVMDDVRLGKALRLRRAKRVVQSMIDLLLSAETNLLGLTNLRSHDEYTYHHSVNVGILSLAIGQRVGLPKNRLVDLGLSAIFHDIGKSCVPLEVLNKPSALDRSEWAVMERHPVLGVKELLRLKGVDALSARIMVGAFEHHLNVDVSGYPRVPYPRGMSLMGRIIAVADCYDALTSARVYRRTADPPEVALRFLLHRSGFLYDRALVKLFTNAVGIYPIGTLCLLTSGEMAVVMQGNPDPELWETPRVRVISLPGGAETDGGVADLADAGEKRRIHSTLDARALGIDVARYFL
jgi:HD-GYP domain-containing protein (c-di-GMP phosphodiesterase class II)